MPEYAVHIRVVVEADNPEAAYRDVEDAMGYTDLEDVYIGSVVEPEVVEPAMSPDRTEARGAAASSSVADQNTERAER